MWDREQAFDRLPTVAAAQLLNLTCIYNGEDEARLYMTIGSSMAQRMGLFGPFRSHHPTPVGHSAGYSSEELDDWERAAAHTAWGVYNCVA
ncbi:MAG: Zn(2)-C6 fungal-type DNA-binding domain protein [Massilia sp.]|nr:Zn(2)-C6 fungal-type DNA-binding domain protein [Massilia sp.]